MFMHPPIFKIFWMQTKKRQQTTTKSSVHCISRKMKKHCNGSIESSPSPQPPTDMYINTIRHYYHDLAAATSKQSLLKNNVYLLPQLKLKAQKI